MQFYEERPGYQNSGLCMARELFNGPHPHEDDGRCIYPTDNEGYPKIIDAVAHVTDVADTQKLLKPQQ